MTAVGREKSLSKNRFVNQKVLVIEFQLFYICGSDIKEAHMACDSNEMILCACDTEKPVWLNKREGGHIEKIEKGNLKRIGRKRTGHVVKKLNVNLLQPVNVKRSNVRQKKSFGRNGCWEVNKKNWICVHDAALYAKRNFSFKYSLSFFFHRQSRWDFIHSIYNHNIKTYIIDT